MQGICLDDDVFYGDAKMFCPKCGSLLVPKTIDGKRVMVCSSCGFKPDVASTKISDRPLSKKRKVEIVDKTQSQYPVVDAVCPKCGNNKAYFMTMQTRASDEPETKFLKCTKCSYTWRDYS